ncbi:MAG: hypothetical protein IJJ20_01995 [Thermoguttaceae bacterium]|nr:hypothetical protein [Thermoguttaceae bacterium]
MAKRSRLSRILIIIGILCPFFSCLGLIGYPLTEGGQRLWWQRLLGALSPYNGSAGLVGVIALLTVLVINRIQFKKFKTAFIWFGLLLLLIVNFFLNIPVLFFIDKYYSQHTPHQVVFQKSWICEKTDLHKTAEEQWFSVKTNRTHPLYITFDSTDISDGDLVELAGNRTIKEIQFHNCLKITENVVWSLVQIPRLERLALSENTQLEEVDFSVLNGLKKLETLELYNNGNLSTKSLESIVVLSRLEELDLAGCPKVDDELLAKIALLKNLRYLNLEACEKITNAGIVKLSKLRHLKYLSIHGCPAVTSEGIRRIKRDLPKCKINWNRTTVN